jgi:hypothetical protein
VRPGGRRWIALVALVTVVGAATAFALRPSGGATVRSGLAGAGAFVGVSDSQVASTDGTLANTVPENAIVDTVVDTVASDDSVVVDTTPSTDPPSTARSSARGPGATHDVSWPGRNTTDPRCAPIFAAGDNPIAVPNFVGMTWAQALVAIDPLGMWSYCNNTFIYNVTTPWTAPTCTSDPAQVDHVAAQSLAPGTPFALPPTFTKIAFTFYALCTPSTVDTTPPTTAPPAPPAT